MYSDSWNWRESDLDRDYLSHRVELEIEEITESTERRYAHERKIGNPYGE